MVRQETRLRTPEPLPISQHLLYRVFSPVMFNDIAARSGVQVGNSFCTSFYGSQGGILSLRTGFR